MNADKIVNKIIIGKDHRLYLKVRGIHSASCRGCVFVSKNNEGINCEVIKKKLFKDEHSRLCYGVIFKDVTEGV